MNQEVSNLADRKEFWEAVNNKRIFRRGQEQGSYTRGKKKKESQLVVTRLLSFREWKGDYPTINSTDWVSLDWLVQDSISERTETLINFSLGLVMWS